jgi:hypothetical protein
MIRKKTSLVFFLQTIITGEIVEGGCYFTEYFLTKDLLTLVSFYHRPLRDARIYDALKSFPYMLRKLFPQRFQGKRCAELVIPISASDYPAMKAIECLQSGQMPCTDLIAPILHFGSVFRAPFFPNMIAMPMPVYNHLDCFEQWTTSQTVCSGLRSVEDGGELVFGNTKGLTWDNLTPQLVWRGSDFPSLFLKDPGLKRPYLVDTNSNVADKKRVVTEALRANYDIFWPRWKGVVHTAEAELEAMESNTLPLINIKISSFLAAGVLPAKDSERYQEWDKFALIGEGMSLKELAKFKYHIDLGGGGGTTWVSGVWFLCT